jgi:putative ABC transport system substrate-binding protein
VKVGLVTSLNRPGGNITGVFYFSDVLGAKRIELLQRMVPKASGFAYLMNPSNPTAGLAMTEIQEAARVVDRPLTLVTASTENEFDTAFATIVQKQIGALLVGTDAFFNSHRERLIALAARHAVPAIYPLREFTAAGGLMSYGTNNTEEYRQEGIYTGRILKGEKPADLPVMQATKFEVVLNLKAAKALGLTVPPTLLATADEVIE